MNYSIKETTQFKKDFKTCVKRGLNPNKLKEVLTLLQKAEVIPIKYKDHQLQPNKRYKNCRELHIEPDWLLVYKYSSDKLILLLIRTGSHSDLFY